MRGIGRTIGAKSNRHIGIPGPANQFVNHHQRPNQSEEKSNQ
jgi:hypothetical protein